MSGRERLVSIENFRSATGKGTVGCLVVVVLLGIGTFVGINAGPPYMAARSFEADLKAEVSKAGARFWDNETLIKSALALAKRNEVRISQENIKVERYSGQLFVKIRYRVPIDLMVYEYIMNVDIKVSSYIGTL